MMNNNEFQFRVQDLSYGWCRVRMLINNKEVNFNASYLGPNPLASLIEICEDFLVSQNEDTCYTTWLAEPGQLEIKLRLDQQNLLHLDLAEKIDDGENIYQKWHEAVHFNAFVSSIVSEAFRVLNAFGLYGYYSSWSDHIDFPLACLLRITDIIKANKRDYSDSCFTDLSKELDCISEHIAKLEITEETMVDYCVVFYESWQLQCCGVPFSVGDKVDWTCIMPQEYKNAHGIILDFEEEHHGFATHSIVGTVSKIVAERSEFPTGKREVWYHKAHTIQEEISRADGRESLTKGDDTTERTFWGYIVELKDVVVKPLSKNDENTKSNV